LEVEDGFARLLTIESAAATASISNAPVTIKCSPGLPPTEDRIRTVPFLNRVQHIASGRERLGWK
jgi:hypothetical protein